MKKIFSTFVVFAAMTSASQAFASTFGTGESSEGGRYCYYLDGFGNPFGDSVSDSNCATGIYIIAQSIDGTNYCYNQDTWGLAYGSPVDGSYCSP